MTDKQAQAEREVCERTNGYRGEIRCTTCGETWRADCFMGEVVDDDALNCHCGSRGEVVR